MTVLFLCGKMFWNAKAHVLAHTQMRKEAGLLGEISNGPLVQRKRRRKELEVAQFHRTVIGFLYSSNASEDRAFSRTGSSEQAPGTSFAQFQSDIELDVHAFHFN